MCVCIVCAIEYIKCNSNFHQYMSNDYYYMNCFICASTEDCDQNTKMFRISKLYNICLCQFIEISDYGEKTQMYLHEYMNHN